MDIIEPKKTTRRSELFNNLIELDRLHKDAAELYKERCEDQGNDGDQFD